MCLCVARGWLESTLAERAKGSAPLVKKEVRTRKAGLGQSIKLRQLLRIPRRLVHHERFRHVSGS